MKATTWHGYEIGDTVEYTDTEVKKIGRKKVPISNRIQGRIRGFSKIGGKDVAEVEVAKLLNGGMTIIALKDLNQIKHALTDAITGPDADGVTQTWKKGALVKLDTPNCEQSHGQVCTIRACTTQVRMNGPGEPADRTIALILEELSWIPSHECRPHHPEESSVR